MFRVTFKKIVFLVKLEINMENSKDLHQVNIETYEGEKSVEHYSKLTKIKDVEKLLIEKYFSGKILDLGCGCGRTTKYLADKGLDVLGVEIVEDMVKKAKKIYPGIPFEEGDACNLKYKDSEFDVVFFSFNGLDYIYPENKRVVALKEINRVLKNGGYFVYSSHNPLSLLFKFRPGLLLRSLKEGKLFSKYKPEKNINFGKVYTYFATPKNQKKLIERNTGLKFVEQVPKGIKEIHLHYVFKKL